MKSPDYLQGFHDGKLKVESNINEAIEYLNSKIQYFTIYSPDGNLTPTVIINANEFKKIIEILKK